MATLLNALIKNIRHEAEGINSIELWPAEGTHFPPFEAGSHIDLHLSNGMIRSYSLLNAPSETGRYVIGVLHDRASRGGSKFVHENLRVGMTIPVSPPRNNFPLQESASHSVLVAGGIGVTPILSMARRLRDIGRSFELLYFARSRRSAAFVDQIETLGATVTWHFDDEKGGPPDLKGLLAACRAQADAHYYGCGPAVLLDAFERECAALGYANAHVERFAALEIKPSTDAKTSYVAELKKSGRTFVITPEKSLLDTLLDGGVSIPFSCLEGICGSCETTVLEGQPDHRDAVLSEKEKVSNKSMMVCVSGCKSERLVLDL